MEFRTAGVIGAGAWGTALAQVCARGGLDVILQAREAEVIESIAARRVNEAFLPGVELNPGIRATSDLADLAGCDVILAVPPAQHMRATLTAFAPHVRAGVPIVLCAKGIERGTLKLMTDVLAETLPDAPAAVLSGPSFAGEVARGLPSAVTLACADDALGEALLNTLSAPGFRPYLAKDLIGAEAGGALKNVLAIACGIVEGRQLGRSAHAAVITRGFAEMTRPAWPCASRPTSPTPDRAVLCSRSARPSSTASWSGRMGLSQAGSTAARTPDSPLRSNWTAI